MANEQNGPVRKCYYFNRSGTFIFPRHIMGYRKFGGALCFQAFFLQDF